MKKVASILLSIDDLKHLRGLIDPTEYLELFRKINDPIAVLSSPIDRENFLKDSVKMGWVECGIEFKKVQNEKSKRITLNIIQDHEFICDCLQNNSVKTIIFR